MKSEKSGVNAWLFVSYVGGSNNAALSKLLKGKF